MDYKGYYDAENRYWGWVGDHYMEFTTEGEYLDYVRESD